MEIVMVTNNALADKMGGVERYVADLSSSLVRKGASVRVIAKRWSRESPARVVQDDGVIIERHRVPSKSNPLYALLYAAYTGVGVAQRTRVPPHPRSAPIVHAHMALSAWPLALSRRSFLMTFHAPVWRELLRERQGSYQLPAPVQGLAVSTLRLIERRVAQSSRQAVVLSDFMRGELTQLSARAGRQALLIPGAVDERRFRPDPGHADRDGPPTLFTARRLTPRTGVDNLIRALPAIRRTVPATRLDIAGTGAMEQELRVLAASLGLEQAVSFLGRISDDALVEHYRNADLVVIPTRELEGFGLTTAEALACGAAVVGTPAGATPELLRPLDPELVTEDTSPAALARTVITFLTDPDRLADVRGRAPSHIMPRMSWDTVADRYLAVYEELGHPA